MRLQDLLSASPHSRGFLFDHCLFSTNPLEEAREGAAPRVGMTPDEGNVGSDPGRVAKKERHFCPLPLLTSRRLGTSPAFAYAGF
jgi:hypothetical protein